MYKDIVKRRANQRRDYLKNRRGRRLDVIHQLGGKCVRCGFDDLRALQLDHVNGQGEVHRRKAGQNSARYYREIAEAPEGEFQVLCANCNRIKAYERQEGIKYAFPFESTDAPLLRERTERGASKGQG